MFRLLPFILIGLTACVPAHTAQARQATLSGDHRRARASWQARLEEAPDDAEARAGIRAATTALLTHELERCRSARSINAWSTALSALREAAALQGAEPRTQLDAERNAAAQGLRESVDALLSVGQPLSAWRFLQPLEPFLDGAGLAALGPELRGTIRTAGARRCVAISHLARGAYLAELVRRACEPLGATTPAVPVAPERRAELVVDALTLTSPRPDARTKLADAARAAFLRSAWADARAQGAVQARVSGILESRIDETPLELTVSWTTSEPYSATESQTESYTESYMTTESYTYTCYSGGRSSTCYGTRSVTRTRPATRTVQKTVTRYRSVSHSRTYPGVQKKAAHRAQLSLAVALPGTPSAIGLTWGDSAEKTDVEHSTQDSAAGLEPHRADVPSVGDWEDRQARVLYERTANALAEAWTKTFCQRGTQTPDDAARCLAGAVGEWPDALVALTRFFGEPLELVTELAQQPRVAPVQPAQ